MRIYNLLESIILPTDKNIELARKFVFKKWQERALEMGRCTPTDLSYSCKFTSQFAQKLFGGKLQGNKQHQFLNLNGKIIDLNIDAEDVKKLSDPHNHDPSFWNNKEHRKSMKSCELRVKQWVEEFINENT